MAPSMRRRTAMEEKRKVRDKSEEQRRKKAAEALKNEDTMSAAAARYTGMSRKTCTIIKFAIERDDTDILQRLLDPIKNRAGRRPTITKEEDQMIKEKIKAAAERAFAF